MLLKYQDWNCGVVWQKSHVYVNITIYRPSLPKVFLALSYST